VPPPPGLGLPMPPNLLGIAVALKKKSDDPVPDTKGIELRKVFLNVVKGPEQQKTFWVGKMDKLYDAESKVKIDWEELMTDFEDMSKKEDPNKIKSDQKAEEYEEILPSDIQTRVEIQL
jgi:hypothetical protein